jgi:L-amino acid N-acyltransferase YncA
VSVVSLQERRESAARASEDQVVTCACGSAWFELRGGPSAPGVVTFATDGRVVGYAGVPTCVDCGRVLAH